MPATLPPLPELPGVEHRFVDAAGLRVHVAEAGSGPPIVLLHGWPQHWWSWREVIPRLAEERRVICPDLRGMGWTDAPAGGYEKHQFMRDLIATMDALGLERVPLVGHDWGGWTTLLAGANAPERFTELLALSIPHPWTASRGLGAIKRELLALSYQGPVLVPGIGPAVVRAGYIKLLLRVGRVDGRFTRDEAAVYHDVLKVPANARASSAVYRTLQLRELPKIIRGTYEPRNIEVPVRLVVGDDDGVANVDLEHHGGHLPQLTIERVPGAGHFLPEERPELVAERALALATGDAS
jgi:pimeloyl-ACP methyl ester carboxylesterase